MQEVEQYPKVASGLHDVLIYRHVIPLFTFPVNFIGLGNRIVCHETQLRKTAGGKTYTRQKKIQTTTIALISSAHDRYIISGYISAKSGLAYMTYIRLDDSV